LERAFRVELHGGRNRVHGEISNQILQGARDGDRTFAIFAAKARLGWRERGIAASATVDASGRPVDVPSTTFTISILD